MEVTLLRRCYTRFGCIFPGTWSCRISLLDQKTVRLEPGERIQMSRTVKQLREGSFSSPPTVEHWVGCLSVPVGGCRGALGRVLVSPRRPLGSTGSGACQSPTAAMPSDSVEHWVGCLSVHEGRWGALGRVLVSPQRRPCHAIPWSTGSGACQSTKAQGEH